MRKRRIARNKYYTVTYDSKKSYANGFLLAVLRNDTAELVSTWRVGQDSMQNIGVMLEELPPPEDWREPYRKCLGYFINKNEMIQGMINYREKESIDLHKLICRRGNYYFHALRMLHDLDAEQIKKLLSLTDRERCVASSNALVASADIEVTFGRVRLYHMLFKKSLWHKKRFARLMGEIERIYPS